MNLKVIDCCHKCRSLNFALIFITGDLYRMTFYNIEGKPIGNFSYSEALDFFGLNSLPIKTKQFKEGKKPFLEVLKKRIDKFNKRYNKLLDYKNKGELTENDEFDCLTEFFKKVNETHPELVF